VVGRGRTLGAQRTEVGPEPHFARVWQSLVLPETASCLPHLRALFIALQVLPLVWALDEIAIPQFLEESVTLFRAILREKTDPALALLAYRVLVQDLPVTVRKTLKSFFPT